MDSHQLINQTSGEVEYYSPLPIVEAARRVMGGIDLDPASSFLANERIKAARIFTEADDGLRREWFANPRWVQKLNREYEVGRVEQLCCITFAATSEAWFTPLLLAPQCFLIPRTNYYLPDGTLKRGVSKGQCGYLLRKSC